MTVTITKAYLPKMKPKSVLYRCYKNFIVENFRHDLNKGLGAINATMGYDEFEKIYLNVLDKHAPCKIKIIRANEAPFMNREIKKSIMTRTRLKNKYIKSPSADNNLAYKTQRNYCTKLLRKRKCEYYSNLDTKLITDNKTFWNTVKPLFSNKMNTSHKITLIKNLNIQKLLKYSMNILSP